MKHYISMDPMVVWFFRTHYCLLIPVFPNNTQVNLIALQDQGCIPDHGIKIFADVLLESAGHLEDQDWMPWANHYDIEC